VSILIKDVLFGKKEQDIYIEDNTIKRIGRFDLPAEKIIDGRKKAVLPPFANSHTHAAMTLLRGYADDMPLKEWLETKIWPTEAKMGEDEIYWGARLACLEMIKCGTTFFCDMYWHWEATAKAVEEMGIRAVLSAVFIDFYDKDKAKEQIELNERLYSESKNYSERIGFALGPHAIYTVSEESLRWAKDFAREHNLLIHIHLSETEEEVKNCVKEHRLRPVEYLEKIGFLGENIIAAHSVWLTDREIDILREYEVKMVYNPVSNMKLAVGKCFRFSDVDSRLSLIGTDGASSNNNLNILEAMKIGALLAKFSSNDPTALPAEKVFSMATENAYKAFDVDSGIREGALADFILVDLDTPELTPGHNLMADIVYSANPSCIDTVICNGKIVMENRRIEGEEEILERTRDIARKIV
jgi:5-methylthioadenosine/S-adenosylhomocysteine deaminase